MSQSFRTATRERLTGISSTLWRNSSKHFQNPCRSSFFKKISVSDDGEKQTVVACQSFLRVDYFMSRSRSLVVSDEPILETVTIVHILEHLTGLFIGRCIERHVRSEFSVRTAFLYRLGFDSSKRNGIGSIVSGRGSCNLEMRVYL